MIRCFAFAVIAGLSLASVAHAGCAGLSAGAIDSRFSGASAVCGSAAPLERETAAPDELAANLANAPTSVAIRYHAPKRAAARPVSARPAAAGRRAVEGRHGPLLADIGAQYRIDPRLLAAIVTQESGGRLGAVSHKGALGLMQLMPATARAMGVKDTGQLLTDPVLNMMAGATYLKQMQAKFGNNLPLVLAAYNAGPGAVTKYGKVPPYRETRGYVSTIMSRYEGRARGGAGAR